MNTNTHTPIYKSGLTKTQFWITLPCCLIPILGLAVWIGFLLYNKLTKGN